MLAASLKPDTTNLVDPWHAATPLATTSGSPLGRAAVRGTASSTEFRQTNGQSSSGSVGVESVGRRFTALAQRWHNDTDDQSVSARIISHPAYLAIVAMGRAALPFIFADFEDTQAFWAPALEAITGESPVLAENKPRAVREAWLAWGKKHGYGVF